MSVSFIIDPGGLGSRGKKPAGTGNVTPSDIDSFKIKNRMPPLSSLSFFVPVQLFDKLSAKAGNFRLDLNKMSEH